MSNKPISQDELQIRDKVYNISNFKKVHPGGSIISFYTGADATEVFNSFHSRSSKPETVLKTIPYRESVRNVDPLMADFNKLKDDLKKEGYFDPSYPHIAYRFLELFILHVIGFYLLINGWRYIGIFVWSLANGRCGWLMHEAGHGSLTGIPKLDKPLQAILFSLGSGMSGAYWNNQHNKHHATPQKLEYDVDLQTLPLVAFSKEVAKKGNKQWLKYQAFLFAPLVTTAVTLFWALYLHPRYMVRTKKWLELFCYTLRWLFVIKYLGPELFLLNALFGGLYIFVNFALSHTHKPVVEPEQHKNWVEYAANHTTNIEPSWWCDWWMGYLNYQIEHHLFPSMPQFKQREVAPRVKALFEKHGLKYDVISYAEAMKKTFQNLHEVGNTK